MSGEKVVMVPLVFKFMAQFETLLTRSLGALQITILLTAACGTNELDSVAARLYGSELGCQQAWVAVDEGRTAGAECSCSVAQDQAGWFDPAFDGPCAASKDEQVGGACLDDATNTWSRRCAIDAYVIACCEAAAEAGCPCGGEAP